MTRRLAVADKVKFQGATTKGLQLPTEVLRNLYHDNAVKWITGIE